MTGLSRGVKVPFGTPTTLTGCKEPNCTSHANCACPGGEAVPQSIHPPVSSSATRRTVDAIAGLMAADARADRDPFDGLRRIVDPTAAVIRRQSVLLSTAGDREHTVIPRRFVNEPLDNNCARMRYSHDSGW